MHLFNSISETLEISSYLVLTLLCVNDMTYYGHTLNIFIFTSTLDPSPFFNNVFTSVLYLYQCNIVDEYDNLTNINVYTF